MVLLLDIAILTRVTRGLAEVTGAGTSIKPSRRQIKDGFH